MKLVVLRHPGRPGRDVAFVGGIDLCHSRRDDSAHFGDPQRQPMATVYGSRPPWHDIQALIRGPAVASGEPIGAAASFAGMFEAFGQAADALDARHAGGRRGPRPAGQLRRYPEPLIPASTRAWASVLYRLVYDPDGRPPAMRRAYEAAASRSPTGSQAGKPMRPWPVRGDRQLPAPGHLHADQDGGRVHQAAQLHRGRSPGGHAADRQPGAGKRDRQVLRGLPEATASAQAYDEDARQQMQ